MPVISIIFWAFVLFIFLLLLIGNNFFTKDESKIKYTKCVLLLSSYAFIIYADIRFALTIAALTVISWWAAKSHKNIKWGIIFSLIALGYFKYTNFFINSFLKIFNIHDNFVLNIILPLGISFYTFSAISYIVDVDRKKVSCHSLFDVAVYLSFFPKLTSGPIQRSGDFFDQISIPRNVNLDSLLIGIQIFCFGLFKKIVLADRLSIFVNQVYDTPIAFSSGTVALAVIAYSLQIYFDFSGYSDMAIGVAKIFDITLPRNFNLPYLAHNVTEFWKRWHITLSSWIKDYLYIPLGGNRKGISRTYMNLILTMLLAGFWHGASWTFVFWGLLYGVALVIHKIWASKIHSMEKEHSIFSNIISILTTFLFVSFCWIFFRAESIPKAFEIIQIILSFHTGIYHPYLWLFVVSAIYIFSALAATVHSKKCQIPERKKKNISWVKGYYPIQNLNSFSGLVIFFVFCGLIFGLAYTGGSPFIYGAY